MSPFSKAPLAQGDLDRLFATGRHPGAVLVLRGDVDDPKIDLWSAR